MPKILDKFKQFNDINDSKNSKNDIKNMDINELLKEYKEVFKDICDKSEKLVQDNCYNHVDFYGLVLCYL